MKRRDGYKDKTIPGMNNLLNDFTKTRFNSEVYMNLKVDVTEFCKYIDELKKENPGLTYFHGMSFIIGKLIYSKPKLNRFIRNRTCYMHHDVKIAFTAKTEFKDEAIEYLTVQEIKPEDTLLTMSKELKKKVDSLRNHKSVGSTNDAVDIVGNAPKPLRRIVSSLVLFLDRHGILPNFLVEGNLYYSSCIVSNIGTFKVGAIYHHLMDFGTASALITFGVIKEEGKRKYMEIGCTIDERVADGFYLCKAVRLMEYMYSNPKILMERADEKVSIPDEWK